MNKRLDELMPKIFELHSLGWSYTKIAQTYNLSVNSVRRRILSGNKLKLGEQHYYKNKYKIELYDYSTNKKVITLKNLNELKKFLNRPVVDFFSQAIRNKIDYVYSKNKEKKYRFKLVDKEQQ